MACKTLSLIVKEGQSYITSVNMNFKEAKYVPYMFNDAALIAEFIKPRMR